VVYPLEKICEVNNDCTDNELCDTQIGICVCSDGYQLDDTKKFCYLNAGNVGLGSNTSGYDVDDVNNVIPEQQQQQQFDSLKKVNRNNYFIFIAIFILETLIFFRYRLKVKHKNHLKSNI